MIITNIVLVFGAVLSGAYLLQLPLGAGELPLPAIPLPTTTVAQTAVHTAISTQPSATMSIEPSSTASPTILATTIVAPTQVIPTAIVIAESLRMREGPDTLFNTIATYKLGERLTILGRNSEASWVKVRDGDGQEGWMAVEFLELNVDLLSITVVASPPIPTPRPTNTAVPAPTARPNLPAPTAAPSVPAPNLDGFWQGPISVGGSIDLTISNRQITRVNFDYAGGAPALEGQCDGVSPINGWGSTINQLRISIQPDSSFASGNINVRHGNTVRQLRISGIINADGSGSGLLEEVFPDFPVPGCTQRAFFTWSVQRLS